MSSPAVQFLVDHVVHIVVGGCLIWFLWKAVWRFVRLPVEGYGDDPGDSASHAVGKGEMREGEDTRQ